MSCLLCIWTVAVSCVYARAPSALSRRADVVLGNSLFEDIVFALEAAKAMKLQRDKSGLKITAKKPEAKPEQKPEESKGKVALFFNEIF